MSETGADSPLRYQPNMGEWLQKFDAETEGDESDDESFDLELGDEEGPQDADLDTVRNVLDGLVKERAAGILASAKDLPAEFRSAQNSPILDWSRQPELVQRAARAMTWGYREHARQEDRQRSRQLNIQQEYTKTGAWSDRNVSALRKALEGWEQYTDTHYFKEESKPERVVTLNVDPSTGTTYLATGGQRLKDGEYGWVLSYADQELFVFDADTYLAVKFQYDKNLKRLTDIIEEHAQRAGNDQGLWRQGFQLIRHPSHVAGEAVYGAGLLTIEGGLIKRLDDNSGHYRPLLQNTGAAAAIIRGKGFFAEGARIELIGRRTERSGEAKDYLSEFAFRMSLHPDQMDRIVAAEASEVDVRKKSDALERLEQKQARRKARYDEEAERVRPPEDDEDEGAR